MQTSTSGKALSRILSLLFRFRFPLVAFLIPLGIRAIPEIIVGPYPVGWDTIAFYVPNTLDWASGKLGLVTLLGTAPLLYMISVPVYWLTRVNPVWIFKIMGPVLYGGLILALYRFLRLGPGWSEKMALGGALLTSLYFVTLRISWDLYRNMLGLTFVLLSLPLLGNLSSRKSQLLLAGLVVLAVASDQLTGVIALSLVAVRGLTGAVRHDWSSFLRMLRVGIPGFLFFIAVAYAGVVVSGVGLVQQQPPVPGVMGLVSSAGFLSYIYLLLVPFVILGLRQIVNVDLRNWLVVMLVLALTALLPFLGFIVMSYRWSLLLDIPLCVYASAGVARILRASPPLINSGGFLQLRLLPVVALILVASAAGYIAMPAQHALSYYTAFPGFLPTSMVQDTVPLSDMGSLRAMLDVAQSHTGPGSVLITHQAIYGWARAYLPSTDTILNYGYSSPLDGVAMARSAGYGSVVMVWWTNGTGWHGQPYVPQGFALVSTDGNMAVYTYY